MAKYIDYVNGNDANPGTRALPLKTLNNSNWTGGVTWASDTEWLLNSDVEHVNSAPVRASGTIGAPVTIGTYGSKKRATISAGGAVTAINTQGRSYVTFKNLSFTGLHPSSAAESIRVWGSNHITVDNCKFYGVDGDQRGIWIYGASTDCVIKKCRFKLLSKGIIITQDPASPGNVALRLRITKNSFKDIIYSPTGADGICFGFNGNALSYNYDYAVVDRNVFYNCADQAIDLVAAKNVIVAGNYIDGQWNNTVGGDHDGIKLGIDYPLNTGHFIFNNFITNVRKDFAYAGSSSFVFINNVCINAGRHAITASQSISKECVILNNIFLNIGMLEAGVIYNNLEYTGRINNNIYYNEDSQVKMTPVDESVSEYLSENPTFDTDSFFNENPLLDEFASIDQSSVSKNAAYIVSSADTDIFVDEVIDDYIYSLNDIGYDYDKLLYITKLFQDAEENFSEWVECTGTIPPWEE